MKKVLYLLVSSVLFAPSAARAVTPVTVDFSATDPIYPDGPVTGFGSFTYDSILVTGVGTEDLSPFGGLLLSFTFEVLGQTFTAADDVDYPFLPVVTLVDGTPDHVDFWVVDSDYYHPPIWANPTPIAEPNVKSIQVVDYFLPDDLGNFTTTMRIEVVPEPTTFSLLTLGSLPLVMTRRRYPKA